MSLGRRFLPEIPRMSERNWNDVRGALERCLRALRDIGIGVPGGFKSTTPLTIKVGGTADPGQESDSWMSAGAQLVVDTGTPSGLANANAEGSSESAARLDHQHKRDVRVEKAGSDVGTRNALNFTDTTDVTFTVSDNGGSDRVDVSASVPALGTTPSGVIAWMGL